MLQGRAISDKNFQLDSLDGLRGLAVLLVVLSHMSNHGIMLFPRADFSGAGKSGVFLFFLLSSFLLTYPFIAKGSKAFGKLYLLNYAFRRFMRIYPLYFAYLTLAFISTFLLSYQGQSAKKTGIPFPLSFEELILHLSLQQGKGVTWSIVVEFHYYFLLPFVAFLFAILLRRRVVPAILATGTLVFIGQLIWPQNEALVNDIRLGPYLPVLLVGSLIAVVHYHLNQEQTETSRRTRMIIESAGWSAAVLLVLLLPSVSGHLFGTAIPAQTLHKSFMLFAILWSLVLLGCIDGTGGLRRIFEVGFLRYLGFISFSAYLLHVMAPGVVTRLVDAPTVQAWAILATSICIAHISWALIERPTSRWRLSK